MSAKSVARAFGWMGLGFWLVALILPSAGTCQIDGTPHEGPYPGYQWASFGWLGVFVMQFGWFANPLLVWSVIRLCTGRWPNWTVATITLGLGLSTLFQGLFTPFNYIDDENDHLHFCAFSSGFYFWILALALPLIACTWARWFDATPEADLSDSARQ